MKKILSEESGFTLLELLASIAIVSLVITIAFSVLTTSLDFNNKSQSQINLRQEANVIVNNLRQKHQQENTYELCYDQLVSDDDVSMELHLDKQLINKQSPCISKVDPLMNLAVQLSVEDKQENSFNLETELGGDVSQPIVVTTPKKSGFYDFIKANNIFFIGSQFEFSGNEVIGPDATMILNGNLDGSQLNGGSFSGVSNIYINGYLDINNGSAGIGSKVSPGQISIDDDLSLWSGRREIYGEVYVNGNLRLKDAVVHGNIYVNGDVELGWTPTLAANTKIYYTGNLKHPDYFSQSILNKVVGQDTVPDPPQISNEIPSLKPNSWYDEHSFDDNIKPKNMKVYGDNIKIDSHNSQSGYVDTFTDAIVVSKGDITVGGNSWVKKMTGVLFAPNGKVTFNGAKFEGLVIAKTGFYVKSGGTVVTFRSIDEYITDAKEFPLESE